MHSVKKSFSRFEEDLCVVTTPSQLRDCKALILPGVGAYDPAIENLEKTSLIPELKEWLFNGNPFFGICLGLQLLFEGSEEGNKNGLGIFKGKVKKLPISLSEKIPHMGWGELIKKNNCPLIKNGQINNWFYFLHSYAADPNDKAIVAGEVQYGKSSLTAMIWKENIFACQFHPEKSGNAGEKLIKEWISLINNS
mgnify:CR=1 FL=1